MSDHAEATYLRDIAIRAARLVEAPLRTAFRSGMDVAYKRDWHDVVTVHDKQGEATIAEFILREVPDSTLVGEEGGHRGSGRVRWYVDPIDGTANFARGFAFWCVSIAAVVDDVPVAGVVLDPVAGHLFAADLDGATCNGRPIRSRARVDEREATLITGYPASRDFERDGRPKALTHFANLAEAFQTLRRPGSAALSISHVAAGWVDAALGLWVNPWDVSAAILILQQAGGRYLPFDLGKVPPGTPAHLCPGYVALGEGADYPTLLSIAGEISLDRSRGERPVPSSTTPVHA
ncbi:MAG: inositol monophosphatase [Devosia sp. 67-54]|uniref:inositol monophosphatase family protein n=1 Tax=unclassified Devosia TaxID=196773 RepID=UPI000959321C|nr:MULTISPECIES: inositol monophosphatase family protein [unclassified Devosia]MBN9306594.1 inositol monophosphatase [Devosia sp.]OJX15875.1 MAG: inositol monophosphatase [Devosia sp. 67-54]